MKKVLYVILAILGLYLVFCIAGPSTVVVERGASINAPVDVIQANMSDYNKFVQWSPWSKKDPAMKNSIEGEPGKPGHKYSWDGNKQVGKGTMEIKSITPDTLSEELSFDGKPSQVYFAFKPEGNATNVNWIMKMKVPFIGRGFMMFFKGKMDKMLGADFEEGLVGLKTVSEAAAVAASPKYNVQEMGWAERTYAMSKTTNLTADKIPAYLGENWMKMMADLKKENVTPQSALSGLYFTWDDAAKAGMTSAAIGIPNGTKVKGWETLVMPACKVLFVSYYGPDSQIGNAHAAIMSYVNENKLSKGTVVEEYITDRGTEKDSAKWQTNIYYVLK